MSGILDNILINPDDSVEDTIGEGGIDFGAIDFDTLVNEVNEQNTETQNTETQNTETPNAATQDANRQLERLRALENETLNQVNNNDTNNLDVMFTYANVDPSVMTAANNINTGTSMINTNSVINNNLLHNTTQYQTSLNNLINSEDTNDFISHLQDNNFVEELVANVDTFLSQTQKQIRFKNQSIHVYFAVLSKIKQRYGSNFFIAILDKFNTSLNIKSKNDLITDNTIESIYSGSYANVQNHLIVLALMNTTKLKKDTSCQNTKLIYKIFNENIQLYYYLYCSVKFAIYMTSIFDYEKYSLCCSRNDDIVENWNEHLLNIIIGLHQGTQNNLILRERVMKLFLIDVHFLNRSYKDKKFTADQQFVSNTFNIIQSIFMENSFYFYNIESLNVANLLRTKKDKPVNINTLFLKIFNVNYENSEKAIIFHDLSEFEKGLPRYQSLNGGNISDNINSNVNDNINDNINSNINSNVNDNVIDIDKILDFE